LSRCAFVAVDTGQRGLTETATHARPDGNQEAFVWFKHRAWIPIAWLLCLANVGATWFAAQPAETWHATTHALLAVLFGVGAQYLTARQRTTKDQGSGAEFPADITSIREELSALREGQSEVVKRVERAVDTIAIELERVGEGQRFLTKVLAEPPRDSESASRSPEPERNS
jgi:hypothetical protein